MREFGDEGRVKKNFQVFLAMRWLLEEYKPLSKYDQR
jgi:hypothetical protein